MSKNNCANSLTISGREASILALLAQSPNLSASDKQRILCSLDGRALKIAKALVGETARPAKSIKDAADGFSAWAQRIANSMKKIIKNRKDERKKWEEDDE